MRMKTNFLMLVACLSGACAVRNSEMIALPPQPDLGQTRSEAQQLCSQLKGILDPGSRFCAYQGYILWEIAGDPISLVAVRFHGGDTRASVKGMTDLRGEGPFYVEPGFYCWEDDDVRLCFSSYPEGTLMTVSNKP